MSISNKCGSIRVGSIVRINSANALHMKLVQIFYQIGLTVEYQQEHNDVLQWWYNNHHQSAGDYSELLKVGKRQ